MYIHNIYIYIYIYTSTYTINTNGYLKRCGPSTIRSHFPFLSERVSKVKNPRLRTIAYCRHGGKHLPTEIQAGWTEMRKAASVALSFADFGRFRWPPWNIPVTWLRLFVRSFRLILQMKRKWRDSFAGDVKDPHLWDITYLAASNDVFSLKGNAYPNNCENGDATECRHQHSLSSEYAALNMILYYSVFLLHRYKEGCNG